MALVTLPRTRQQPAGRIVLNRAHPIANAIRFWIVPDGQGGFYDAVRQVTAARNGTASRGSLLRTYGVANNVKLASAGSDYLAVPSDPSYNIIGDIGLLWSGQINAGSNYREFVCKMVSNGATSTPFEFRTDNSASPVAQLVRSNAGGTVNTWTGPTVPLGKPFTLGVALAATDDIAQFFLNNNQTPTASVSAFVADVNTAALQVGRRPDGVVQMDGFTEYVIGWARKPKPWEFDALYTNPYLMALIPKKRVYFGVPGTAGSIVSRRTLGQRVGSRQVA